MATFGKETIGATGINLSPEKLTVNGFAKPKAGTIPKLTAYIAEGGNTGTAKMKAVVYADDGAGKPSALLAEGLGVNYKNGQGTKWVDLPFQEGGPLANGTRVHIGILLGGTPNVAQFFYDDIGAAHDHTFAAWAYATPSPASFPVSPPPGFDQHVFSIYATYTVAAPVVTNPATQTNTVGVPIVPIRVTGTSVETWSATGLPAGLSIDPATGYISGTPTAIGAPTVTVRGEGEVLPAAEQSFTWNVVSVATAGTYNGYTAFSPLPGTLGSSGSAFNRLVGQSRVLPSSAAMVTWLLSESNSGLGVAHQRNQFPTVYAKNSDPQVEILDAAKGFYHKRLIRIPVAAKVQSNSDKHLQVVLCPSDCAALGVAAGTTADFWHAGGAADPSETLVYEGGGTKLQVASSGNGQLSGDLVFTGKSVAANYDLNAGVIRGPELLAGDIKHALVAVCRDVLKSPAFVYPANHTDGSIVGLSQAAAMGQRFYLAMSDSEIEAAGLPHPFLVAVAKAIARYGFYLEDTGPKSGVAFRTENDNMQTAFGAPGYMARVAEEQGLVPDGEGVLLDYSPLLGLLGAHLKAIVRPASSNLPTPFIATPAPRAGVIGQADTFTPSATGVASWAATGLPAGMSIDAATGQITGTPTTLGPSSVTLIGAGAGTEVETSFTWLVRAARRVLPFLPSPRISSGRVISWGEGAHGRQGIGIEMGESLKLAVPELVLGPAGVTTIGCGGYQSYCVDNLGREFAWGTDGFSAGLGMGTANFDLLAPAENPFLSTTVSSERVVQLGGLGAEAAALLADGRVKAWGANGKGAAGVGDITTRYTPRLVETAEGSPLTGVTAICSAYSSCSYLKGTGVGASVWRSGSKDIQGQFLYAQEEPAAKVLRESLTGGKYIKAIAAGYHHTVLLISDGTVRTFGRNLGAGFLGIGEAGEKAVEEKAETLGQYCEKLHDPGLTGVVAIAASTGHSLALKSDGTVRAWGKNDLKQCGQPDASKNVLVPTVITVDGINPLTHAEAIVAAGTLQGSGEVGTQFSLAMLNESGVKTIASWGGNEAGNLGDGTYEPKAYAVPVKGGYHPIAIAAAEGHCIAIVPGTPAPTLSLLAEELTTHSAAVTWFPFPGDRADVVNIEWGRFEAKPTYSAWVDATKDSNVIQFLVPPIGAAGFLRPGLQLHYPKLSGSYSFDGTNETIMGSKPLGAVFPSATTLKADLGGGRWEVQAPRRIEASPAGFTINCLSHGLGTGQYIYFKEINGETTLGKNVGGLVIGQNYYVHHISKDKFAVATSKAAAAAATSTSWISFTEPLTAQTATDAVAQLSIRPVQIHIVEGSLEVEEAEVEEEPEGAAEEPTYFNVIRWSKVKPNGYDKGAMVGNLGKRWRSLANANKAEPKAGEATWEELGTSENVSMGLAGSPPGGYPVGTVGAYTILDLPLPGFWLNPADDYEVTVELKYNVAHPKVKAVAIGGNQVRLEWPNEGGGNNHDREPGWSPEIRNGTVGAWVPLPEVPESSAATVTLVVNVPAGWSESTLQGKVAGTYRSRYYKRGRIFSVATGNPQVPRWFFPPLMSFSGGLRPSFASGPTALHLAAHGKWSNAPTSYSLMWGIKDPQELRPFVPFPSFTGTEYAVRKALTIACATPITAGTVITTTAPHGLSTGEIVELGELGGVKPRAKWGIVIEPAEAVNGLTLRYQYYVRVVDATHIELARTLEKALSASTSEHIAITGTISAATSLIRPGDIGHSVTVSETASNANGTAHQFVFAEPTREIQS